MLDRQRHTVSSLVRAVSDTLGESFGPVEVEGELSNVSTPASGHLYLTIKDAKAQMRAVMWRSARAGMRFRPENGQQIRAFGRLNVYAARGDLQLQVDRMELAGEGALQAAFEKLKRALHIEGLFDPAHKKPIPELPERIGVVTSGTGAAVRDVISVLGHRYPAASVVVCPVPVQGDEASPAIVRALRSFNRQPAGERPDVILLVRGGGSLEDLWAFNEEATARAVHASGVPIISGVGHETDTTIVDYVADLRAATPSQAAELAVPDARGVALAIRRELGTAQQRLATRVATLQREIRARLQSRSFRTAEILLGQYRQHVDVSLRASSKALEARVAAHQRRLEGLRERIRALDPRRPLAAGYVRVEREGRPVREARTLADGDKLALHFVDGCRDARILRSEEN